MSVSEKVKKIEALLPRAMMRDRERYSKSLRKIRHDKEPLPRLSALEKKIDASIRERERRLERRPEVSYPEILPITEKKDEIIHAIKENPVVVISGETGSGKSTQIPKMCLEAGRGIDGMIGCTQPRRIAATTIGRPRPSRIPASMNTTPSS